MYQKGIIPILQTLPKNMKEAETHIEILSQKKTPRRKTLTNIHHEYNKHELL